MVLVAPSGPSPVLKVVSRLGHQTGRSAEEDFVQLEKGKLFNARIEFCRFAEYDIVGSRREHQLTLNLSDSLN